MATRNSILNETLTPEFEKSQISGSLLALRRDLRARDCQWASAEADAAPPGELNH